MPRGLLRFLAVTALLLSVVSGCGASKVAPGTSNAGSVSNVEMAYDSNANGVAEAQSVAYANGTLPSSAAALQDYERKIVKNADLTLTAVGVQQLAAEVEKEAESMGGFVSSSAEYRHQNGKLRVEMTVRIPGDKFSALMTWLEQKGETENKHIYTEDVTEEYIDLEARINNLTAQEKRLQAMLDQATTVDQMLKIERELERIRGEVDSLTGRLNYLKNRVTFSTVNLTLRETGLEPTNLATKSFSGTLGNGFSAMLNSINTLMWGLNSLIILFFSLIPFLIVLAIAGAIYLMIRRRIKNKKDSSE